MITYAPRDADGETHNPGVPLSQRAIKVIRDMWDAGYTINEINHFTGRPHTTITRYIAGRPQPARNPLSISQRYALMRGWPCVR